MTALSFVVNDNHYMFDISDVNSIIELETASVKPMPDSPDFLLGITQHRNRAIGVLSAAVLFGQSQSINTTFKSIVIVKGEEQYAVVVDEVQGVRSIEDTSIQHSVAADVNPYASSVFNDGETLYLIIDVTQLIDFKNIGGTHVQEN